MRDAAYDVPGLRRYEADVEKRQRATEQADQEWDDGEYDEDAIWHRLVELAEDILQHVYAAAQREAEAWGEPSFGAATFCGFLSSLRTAGAGPVLDRIREEWKQKRFEQIMQGGD